MPPLEIQYRPIETLIPYARNARTHSDEQITQIAASIREFGFNNPILADGHRGVVSGHARGKSAQETLSRSRCPGASAHAGSSTAAPNTPSASGSRPS